MPSQTRVIWTGAAGAAVVVAGAAVIYVVHPSFLRPAPVPATVSISEPAPPPPAEAGAPAVAAPQRTAAPQVKPAFDVVNVEPTGEAVIAGRAAPNAKVELQDAGKMVAEATTDSAGQFVIIPPVLAPGDHSLTLATGQSAAETSNAIPIVVPEPPPKTAVAAATPSKPGTASSTSAGPAPATPAPAPSGSVKVAIRSVETSAGGKMVAMGAAEPNATVRLYLSGAFVGDAKTKADGRWSLTIEHGMTAGAYEVRADQINPADATVVARAEARFDFPAVDAFGVAAPHGVASADGKAAAPVGSPSNADVVLDFVRTHHVEKGHTLWGISQKFYGDGSRYELIFAANTNQIKNPNLIYPGQMFVVPRPEPKP